MRFRTGSHSSRRAPAHVRQLQERARRFGNHLRDQGLPLVRRSHLRAQSGGVDRGHARRLRRRRCRSTSTSGTPMRSCLHPRRCRHGDPRGRAGFLPILARCETDFRHCVTSACLTTRRTRSRFPTAGRCFLRGGPGCRLVGALHGWTIGRRRYILYTGGTTGMPKESSAPRGHFLRCVGRERLRWRSGDGARGGRGADR